MRKKGMGMLGLEVGFETPGSTGNPGGTAVAAPPAAPPAAAPNPNPAAGSGAPAAGGGSTGIFGGKVPARLDPALANKTAEPDKATNSDALPRVLFGRYKLGSEVEDALKRSQDEGIRLASEVKSLRETHQRELSAREAKLAEIQERLEFERQYGSFREMKPEELDAMAKESPRAYADYLYQKGRHEDQFARVKTEKESREREYQRQHLDMRERIAAQDAQMRRDTENYPQYAEVVPVMEQIVDETRGREEFSPVTGHDWTAKLLYEASMGRLYLSALKASRAEEAKATEAARLTAAAGARVNQAPGVGGKPGEQTDNQKYIESVLAAAPKRVFGPRK